MLIKMIIGVGITIVMLDASIVIFTMNAIAVKYDSEFGLREKIDYGSYPAGLTIGCQSCLYIENPTLDVGFKKAYSYTDDRKTPFDRMSCGLPTATKISKGGHSRSERHPQSITHKMEL